MKKSIIKKIETIEQRIKELEEVVIGASAEIRALNENKKMLSELLSECEPITRTKRNMPKIFKNGMTVVDACRMILDDKKTEMSADDLAKVMKSELNWKTNAKYFPGSISAVLSSGSPGNGIGHKYNRSGNRVFFIIGK